MLSNPNFPRAADRELPHLGSEAILVCALADNTIEYWSDGAEALYGYSAEEAVGHTTLELIRTVYPRPLREIQEELRARHAWSGELRQRAKDGRELQVISRMLWHDGGGRQYFFEINRNVSKRNQDETGMGALDRELAERNREVETLLDTRERFIAALSHELRTPLNAILGFSNLLRENGEGAWTEKQRRFVEHIHGGGRHILQLINEMLDLAAIDAGRLTLRRESVELQTAVRVAMRDLELAAQEKRIAVAVSVDAGFRVWADSVRLRQILGNLLSNAIKFTPPAGQVWFAAKRNQSGVEFVIQDTGIGIEAGEQRHAFEEFWRSTQAGPQTGAGLGLAITRRLVEAHGGSIRLESEVGHGSEVYVTLPAA